MSSDHGDPEAGPVTAASPLTFPDLPRLELDELLGQLVDRANEVMGTQGRLRGLLRANQLIITELDLPSVLRHVTEAARDLIGARYAALGVIGDGDVLQEFVHVGMPPEIIPGIGHLPDGKGLLGALIENPEPIRLGHIADDPRSSGFPDGHPPMHSFLGVPIEIRGEVFGNLYLTESTRGAFSAEDEQLAQALAATAAVAIENARLYASAHVRGEWLQASAAITRHLLSPDTDNAGSLHLVAQSSREVSGADLVVLALPGADRESLAVEVAVGEGTQGFPGRPLALENTICGRVFVTQEPLRLRDPGEAGFTVLAPSGMGIGPAMAVPLLGSAGVHGVLAAFKRVGQKEFSAEDLTSASGFANQAAVAIELAQARAEQQRAAMLDERARIAADLHDHVIQRLFGAGLSLQSLVTRDLPEPAGSRIAGVIDELDKSISQIRTTIFQLQRTPGSAQSPRARLLDVVAEMGVALGFDPGLRFSGLLDALRGDVVDDLVAVVREGLSNVARHAHAHRVEIEVTVSSGRLTLQMEDDGVGLRGEHAGNGLANLRRRAERHGGQVDLQAAGARGTTLLWTVSVS
ncbi:two-component system sensor histidine kinase [Kineosporia mesophila]|uniref:Two-component system sensor histidine kinase n=1 Tax=Kineosporia mesophila TaxID=566012 RepID=A0ABP6Z9I9_9ACTN|nr:GAF domain-containing protein [Kineosporia mesophila]MCD5354909.1 GAF domain-containing protein [Kineosporia mesophila]